MFTKIKNLTVKQKLLILFILSLTISLGLGISQYHSGLNDKFSQTIFRTALTIFLMYKSLSNKTWAQWFLGICYLLAGFMGFSSLTHGFPSFYYYILIFIMSLIYFITAYILLFKSKEMKTAPPLEIKKIILETPVFFSLILIIIPVSIFFLSKYF